MRLFALLLITTSLPGCIVSDREYREIDTYSRSEIDAINIEGQCKLLARNLLQLDRCKVRR